MPNTLQLIDALRRRPVASRAELQADTGLSAASISRALSELRAAGLVEEESAAVSGVGRPPSVVRFRPEAAHVVGIDAGGASLRVEIVDLAGRFIARSSVTLRGTREADGDRPADRRRGAHARPARRRAADRRGGGRLRHRRCRRGHGAAVAGPARAERARRRHDARRRLGMPVAIDNDDLLAAAGEAAFGAAEGCTEVVFLSLGLGLGAGLLVGGRPVRGVRSAAGAIAYFAPGALAGPRLGPGDPASLQRAPGERAGTPRRTAKRVIELAAAGDADATAVIEDAVEALGALAVNVGALLDPEVIVLGGGLARGIPALADALAARLRDALPFPPRVVLSELGEDAVARGAGSLALTLGQRQLAGVTAEPGRLGALEFV